MSTFKPTMEIRINLEALLDERKVSQRELARMINVRSASINDMCQNKTIRMPLDNLASICEVLDVSISDVLELVPIETKEND
ncbi:helix-turn-helix transcriptional regulator [Paenibacillus sp. SC116]|uniref:helix-turn-helix domain-containing protein n=1 Tax=Paenibacillus sp. SC116 TaxID=2968986 RepID=UPI00215AB4E7|nr:helix-turn-helix transcriptional regulator [Paenibacillus sp. SC116]MCR8843099.1 helix-turn-helix transcriptional regulator [Paenibacillus sp. SC116]